MESNLRPKAYDSCGLPLGHRGLTIDFGSKAYFMFNLIFGH
jgi:hypothetical protein